MVQAMLGRDRSLVRWTTDAFHAYWKARRARSRFAPAGVGNGRMTFAAWWRRVLSRRGRSRPVSREASEAGITARVDMVRFEALAEAAHEAMYEARLRGAKGYYEEARAHFAGAIEAAQRAGLHEEAARLKRRRDHVARVYNSQFRYS